MDILPLSPDESGDDDKKRVRREKNRLAAQRCRQRRVSKINGLSDEIMDLDAKRLRLEQELDRIRNERDQLLICYQNHRLTCKKTFETDYILNEPIGEMKSESLTGGRAAGSGEAEGVGRSIALTLPSSASSLAAAEASSAESLLPFVRLNTENIRLLAASKAALSSGVADSVNALLPATTASALTLSFSSPSSIASQTSTPSLGLISPLDRPSNLPLLSLTSTSLSQALAADKSTTLLTPIFLGGSGLTPLCWFANVSDLTKQFSPSKDTLEL